MFRTACVQLCTGRSIDENIETTCGFMDEAARAGANLIVTPEMTALMELGAKRLFANIVPQEEDRALAAFRKQARELECWLLIGSLAVLVAERKAANRSFLIRPDGSIAAFYDKLHMFDVDLPGGESYRESSTYAAGCDAVAAELPWGRLGLTICYDLRFPALYRSLALQNAHFLTVPAAFTRQTGEAHWHVLLRARAIENGAFVFAAAQGGTHENGRETFGHSMIIDPWGEILVEAGTEPGVIWADIDPARVAAARNQIPSLEHDRAFSTGAADDAEKPVRVAS